MSDIDRCLDFLQIKAKNKDLYKQALRHKSVSLKEKAPNNERLEFLGDRILGFVMSEWLFHTYPGESEGDLAKRQAVLVSRSTLLKVSQAMGIPEFISMSLALRSATASRVESLYANAVEALIAAIYLDLGMDFAKTFVLSYWKEHAQSMAVAPKDAKSRLQEWAQSKGLEIPTYFIAKASGPDHAPNFDVGVCVQGYESIVVQASSRKSGEQKAARAFLDFLGEKS